jgi:hypothetical protein
MSDFLTNLIARSVGSAEVVRPRLPSLYEPLRSGHKRLPESDSASQWAAEAPSEETGFEIEPVADAAEEVRRRPPQRLLPTVHAGDLAPSPSPNPVRRERQFEQKSSTGESPKQDELVSLATDGSVIPKTPVLGTAAIAMPQPPSSQPLHKPERPQSSVAGLTAISAGRTAETKLHPIDAQPQPKSSIQPQAPGAIPDNESKAGVARSMSSLNASIARPSAQADQSPPLPSRVMQPGEAHRFRPETRRVPNRVQNGEPTIQVTIGRVEVRAVPEQTGRARKERSPSPVMGLDEYLRRRAKGGTQ